MKAVLLAAGYGTRLRPITISQPKCLVNVGGKPLLARWLETLGGLGIGPVLVNLHHLADEVQSYIEQRSDGVSVVTVYESALVGTGGTIRENREFFGQDKVMVIHADNLCLSNLMLFKKAHDLRPKNTDITMLTFRSDDPAACGIVEVDDDGIVQALHEKVLNPPDNLANGAVYIFESDVIDFIHKQKKTPLDLTTDILPAYLTRIFSWPADDVHIDIGTHSNLARADKITGAM